MQRSASASRVSEASSYSSPYKNFKPSSIPRDADRQQLPTYDPLSHVAQRERSRLRLAEKAVHLIPILLILCVIILWFFSFPDAGLGGQPFAGTMAAYRD